MLNITDQALKNEYLNKHLPYRVNSMLAHDLIMLRKTQSHFLPIRDTCYGDSTVVEPIFEISLVFGRCLLNFLGLSKENSSDRLINFFPKSDDLTIKSLFPQRDYCDVNEQLVIDNYDSLCLLIKLANKSVAHLTSVVSETMPEEYNKLPQARFAIYQLTLKYVPEINKQNIWWYNQIEK